MREIKFRAWEKTSESMVYDVQNVSRKRIIGESACESFQEVVDSWEYETMQYTGLKDKNGKEIYEGDVVEYLDGEFSFIAKVAWSDWMWYLEGINPKESFMFDDVADNETADVEIIGNIYENPELLEDEE